MEKIAQWLLDFVKAAPIWATVIIVAAMILSILLKWLRSSSFDQSLTKTTSRLDHIHDVIENRLSQLNEALKEAPETAGIIVKEHEEKIAQLESKFSSLRTLIFDNPDQAITIPLIKKDIDGIKSEIERINTQIGWLSSYNKWLIGVMITLAVGVLGLALSIILKS